MHSMFSSLWIRFFAVCFAIQFTCQYDESKTLEELQSLEVQLIDAKNILRSRFHYCTSQWKEGDSPADHLRGGLVRQYWHEALHTARALYREDIKCLMDMKPLLEKHSRIEKILEERRYEDDEKVLADLDAFLTRAQVKELRHLHENGDQEAVEQALDQYFQGLPSPTKDKLLAEFLHYEAKPRRVERDTDSNRSSVLSAEEEDEVAGYEEEVLEPDPLKPEWLAWQTPRHKKLINKMIIGKASKWEIMNEVGDQFYHLRKEQRTEYKGNLENYCIRNLKSIIGERNFNVLRGMYMDTDPVEQIETKFHELVAELSEERKRLLADHYGVFCRKIFRLVHFEPTDLTIWLTSSQKLALGVMIQDQHINDTQIYDKMYEFYANTTGEAKDEARDIIESGCRHFIAHMFGDDNAEELEELRLAGSVSKQQLAARLATHALEVSDVVDRKRAEGSLSICIRIYLGYDNSCECHGHSETCDSVRHNCLNCTDNTYGVQCELCEEGFTGDPLTGPCTSIEPEETPCTCNNHSTTCDSDGKCQFCLHNTTGDSCERCAAGFYGDATTGTADDCTRCPCPNNGDCFVNDNNLVQCNECPNGTHGITCEEDAAVQKEEKVDLKTTEESKKQQKIGEMEDRKQQQLTEKQKTEKIQQQSATGETTKEKNEHSVKVEGNHIDETFFL